MLKNQSMIKLLTDFICDIKEKKKNINSEKKVLRTTYNGKLDMFIVSPMMLIMTGVLYTIGKSIILSTLLSIATFIILKWVLDSLIAETIERKISKKIEDIDIEKLLIDFLQENERAIIVEINTCLEKNKEEKSYRKMIKQFEQIKLDFINKDWEMLAQEIPYFFKNLKKRELKNKEKLEKKTKLKEYNILLSNELNTKEKEVGVNYTL